MEILKHSILGILMLLVVSTSAQGVEEAFLQSYKLEQEIRYDEAASVLIKVYDKKSYATNLRLGWLNYLSGQLMQSSEYYDICLKLKPLSIEARLGKTYPESSLGNWKNVKSLYSQILQIAPNNYTANLKLAQIYFYAGEYTKSEKVYKLILNQYPFTFDVVIGAAWNNYYLGKLREAKILFKNALLLYPDNESAKEGLNLIK